MDQVAVVVSLFFAAALAIAVPSEEQLLFGIRGVESSHGVNLSDGDLDRPLCERSRGGYQVTPRAVRELVRVGLLKPMAGFSLTNCVAIREWLGKPGNNKRAARLYLRLMLQRNGGDVEAALCAYNGADKGCRYAGAVLLIAAGE